MNLFDSKFDFILEKLEEILNIASMDKHSYSLESLGDVVQTVVDMVFWKRAENGFHDAFW